MLITFLPAIENGKPIAHCLVQLDPEEGWEDAKTGNAHVLTDYLDEHCFCDTPEEARDMAYKIFLQPEDDSQVRPLAEINNDVMKSSLLSELPGATWVLHSYLRTKPFKTEKEARDAQRSHRLSIGYHPETGIRRFPTL